VRCFDDRNNVTEEYEYDYGFSAGMVAYCQPPAGWLRRTETTYNTSANYTDPTVNLVRLPTEVNVYSPSGAATKTTFVYDNRPLTDRSSAPQHDSAFGTSYTIRGNVTEVARGLGASPPTIKTTYDILGNVVEQRDARDYPTTYAFNGTCGYAFPTTITNPLNHSATFTYDCGLGKPTQFTNPNGGVTSYTYESSSLRRLTEVAGPLGTRTTYIYDDDPGGGGVSVTTSMYEDLDDSVQCTQNQWVTSTMFYDGLGRESESRLSTAAADIKTLKTYDARGRLRTVSNPFIAPPPRSSIR
jgi:YD repeat-containing protein